ncbi:MAG: hypothetical protein NTV49_16495 [Kiritimatiellaeota bacterium]|nr:hypothetical protein [Kiritimatiellota bacterium]
MKLTTQGVASAGLTMRLSRQRRDRSLGARGGGAGPLLVGILAVLVIIISLASPLRRQYRATPRTDLTQFRAVGEVAAQEISRLLGRTGRVVVLAWYAEGQRPAALEEQLLVS